MTLSKGQSVMYNSKCCTIFKLPGKRLFGDDSVGYLIRENRSGNSYDNILESDLTECSSQEIVNDIWNDFTYTGDNIQASKWITNNLIIHLNNTNNLEWGHNQENTQYSFIIEGTTYTKDRS